MSNADEEVSEFAIDNQWRDVAEAMNGEGDPHDPSNLSNEELLELVAELDPEKYPVARRAVAALDQLEDSEA
jgi:hypothetical protein